MAAWIDRLAEMDDHDTPRTTLGQIKSGAYGVLPISVPRRSTSTVGGAARPPTCTGTGPDQPRGTPSRPPTGLRMSTNVPASRSRSIETSTLLRAPGPVSGTGLARRPSRNGSEYGERVKSKPPTAGSTRSGPGSIQSGVSRDRSEVGSVVGRSVGGTRPPSANGESITGKSVRSSRSVGSRVSNGWGFYERVATPAVSIDIRAPGSKNRKAAQAKPLILSMEDPLQSSAEVLVAEVENMSLEELRVLHKRAEGEEEKEDETEV